jgi:putative nucleotidyltransferase with HDIG domain
MEAGKDPVTEVATTKRRAPAPKKGAAKALRKPARPRTDAKHRKPKAPKTNGAVPKPAARQERGGGQGGRRLATAFDAASRLPALAESSRRVLRAAEHEGASPGELAETIESDVALTIAVMRAAGDVAGEGGRAGGVRQAIETLTAPGVRDVVSSIDTYNPFDSPGPAADRYERFRRHAVATRHAADRIGELTHLAERDELAVSALVHDIGRLVLSDMYEQFERLDARRMAPDVRVRCERRELGIDHALVGAVLVRRWGFPRGVAAAVERHHSPREGEHPAAIRLADLIAHHAQGEAAPADAMIDAASRLGLERERLASLLYEFPHAGGARPRSSDPCPLSVREVDALRGLAEGKVYKQIASELSLSVSTIRTHLHNVYRKIDAVDRAQAVLIARDRGWI